MEARGITRNSTLSSLSKKALLKTKPPKNKSEEDKENNEKLNAQGGSIFIKHPGFKFIRDTSPSLTEYKKFTTLLYKGLFYAVNNLKGPSQEYIRKKQVKLPEPTGNYTLTQTPSRSSSSWTSTRPSSTPCLHPIKPT